MTLSLLCSFLIFVHSLKTFAGMVLTKQTCEAVPHAVFHGSSCFVIPINTANRVDALNSCNQFPNGHLAYVTTERTLDVIGNLTDDPGINSGTLGAYWVWFKIGLVQVDRSQEPAGGWAYDHPDGRIWMVPDIRLILFGPGQPNNDLNGEHAGYYDIANKILNDGNGPTLTPYICEYETGEMQFKLAAKDQIGHDGTKLAEHFGKTKLGCAIDCHRVPVCRGFSYKTSDGHCILYFTTSVGVPDLPPVGGASGYEMYDSDY